MDFTCKYKQTLLLVEKHVERWSLFDAGAMKEFEFLTY
jgi:hypothetical protein